MTVGVQIIHSYFTYLQAATSNNLRVLLGIVLKKFRIEPRLQLVAFTVDSGANYVLAGKLLADAELQDMEDGATGEVEEAVDDVEAGDDEDWLHSTIELRQDDFSMQGVRCASHTLQLAVGDALRREKDLKQIIDAVRKLAKYLLKESHVRKLREAKMALPQLDVVTRWGSTYDMLKSVANLRTFLSLTFEWPTLNEQIDNDLTEEEWEKVNSILADLRAVRLATTQLQREDITLGEFFAVWSGVVMALKARKEASSLAHSLLRAMEERAKAVPYKDRSKGDRQAPLFHYPSFSAAVFMDPRYMSLLTAEQVQEAKHYLLNLWDRLQTLQGPASPQPEADSEAESEDDALLNDEDEGTALFRALLDRKNKERLAATGAGQSSAGAGSGSKASRRTALRALLDEHDRNTAPLAATESVFEYWEKKKLICPELYALAMVVLTIPASQVSVERLFSALRFILRPQRFGLSSRHVDDVTFLNANKDVVQSVVKDLLLKKPARRRASASDPEEET